MDRLLNRGTVFAFTILLLIPSSMIYAGLPVVHTQPNAPYTPPPTITITGLSPNPAKTGDVIRLNFTATDSNATVTATWVDWGDGSTPDLILNDTSPSMCPSVCTIAPNDLIFGKIQDPSTIMNGSIIIFTTSPNNGFLVVHRVVGIIPASSSVYGMVSFRTMGDANPGPDCWTPYCYIPASWVVAVYQYTLAHVKPGSGARYDTHTYPNYGPALYEIHLNATVITGPSTSLTTTLTINDQPPTARIIGFTANSDGTRTSVSLDILASDPDGAVNFIRIDWGDGTTTILTDARSSAHIYSASGTYTISVTAIDNSGSTSQSDTKTFTVNSSSRVITLPTLFGLSTVVFYGTILGAALVGAATILALTLRSKRRN